MQRKCNEAYTGNRMCLFCYLTGLQQNHWIVGKEAPRMKLKGKAAVITGASKGIGEGIAKVYAKYGAKCILAARGEQVLALAEKMRQEGYDVIGVRTDVSDYESVRQLARLYRRHTAELIFLSAMQESVSWRILSMMKISETETGILISISMAYGIL